MLSDYIMLVEEGLGKVEILVADFPEEKMMQNIYRV